MKYDRKCPCCNKKATTKFGIVFFCNDCAKYVRRNKMKYVLGERLIGEIHGTFLDPKPLPIYTDVLIKVH